MKKFGRHLGRWALLIPLATQPTGKVRGEPSEKGMPLLVRLVHPDRQAAEFLRLFEGSRTTSPAAALATWKQSQLRVPASSVNRSRR